MTAVHIALHVPKISKRSEAIERFETIRTFKVEEDYPWPI